jgi:peptidylprolyl isomerase
MREPGEGEQKHMAKARLGDTVKVHYRGLLEDGTVFDSSEGCKPWEFVVGEDQLIEGLRSAVIGMSEGEKKTVTVSVEEGYGLPYAELVSLFPRSAVPRDVVPEPGMIFHAHDSNGQESTVRVVCVDEQSIVVDRNHPLAGETLIFELELLSVTAEECRTHCRER